MNPSSYSPFHIIISYSDIIIENTQITLNKKNMIEVDEFQTTKDTHIYAVGDVSSNIQLTPTAIAGEYHRHSHSRYCLTTL